MRVLTNAVGLVPVRFTLIPRFLAITLPFVHCTRTMYK